MPRRSAPTPAAVCQTDAARSVRNARQSLETPQPRGEKAARAGHAPRRSGAPATPPAEVVGEEPAEGRRARGLKRRRGQIVDAARRLLVERPASFSMRNVAAEACVSVFTVYKLVGGQAAVIEAVVNDPARDLITRMRENPRASSLDELLSELRRFDREWDDDSREILAIVRALPYLRAGALQDWFRDGLTAHVLPLITAATEAGELRRDPAPEVMIAALGAICAQAAQGWSEGRASFNECKRTILSAIGVVLLSAMPEERRAPWEGLVRRLSPTPPRRRATSSSPARGPLRTA